jgi:hypothetical protein
MTTKLKNRLQKMKFQRTNQRRIEVEEMEDTKYYEELYRKRTMELLGIQNENVSGTTGRGLRSQHI